MKRSALLVLGMFLLSSTAFAQLPSSPVSLFAGGLLSYPKTPDAFKESYKTGYHFFGGLGIKAMPMVQLVAKAEFNTFGFDFANNDLSGISGGTTNIWMFGADSRFSLGAPVVPVKPFIFGGAGLANITYADFTGTDPLALAVINDGIPESQNKLYYNFGGGLELKSGPMMSFFAQVRYVSIQTENEASVFIPVSVGLKFF